MSTNTCRCRKDVAPEAQVICSECAVFQTTTCALCRQVRWWQDVETVDGRPQCWPSCETQAALAAGGQDDD